ncbi:MAG: RidA family protein [Spirochaetaceae bacterium]|jgi:enamine deaminase RidA (YjgF/YER057c/UK114 family)|nr:RidA family protein [Spirochaetaceae bacterium]
MIHLEQALKKYNLTFPAPPAKAGIYEPVKEFGANFCYLSGCVPVFNGEARWQGKLGGEFSVEQGQEAARVCALNLLANIKAKYGSLERVKRIVKMLAFVAGTDTFYDHPKVANGASELFVDVFGEEAGRCSRSAIGVNALPGNAPVEIELLVELNAA